MADKADKWPDNIPGKFYVDRVCIDCDTCGDIAPNHFRRNEDGYYYVYRQPSSEKEADACNEAMWACPGQAIGDDGDT